MDYVILNKDTEEKNKRNKPTNPASAKLGQYQQPPPSGNKYPAAGRCQFCIAQNSRRPIYSRRECSGSAMAHATKRRANLGLLPAS